MDSNNFNDEIEELNEEPNATEENLENIDEDISQSSNDNFKFGEREYKKAKDENGHYDKDYYKKRGQELDEKVNEAKEEKARNWKTEKKDDEQNKNNDNKESTDKNQDKGNDNLKQKPEEERQNKNKFDKLKDNINLEKSKYERWQNKLDGIKAKTYQTMHPIEAAKEEVKEKAKTAAKETGKKAAKATGRLLASGGKAVISFLAANPIVLAALAILVLLFIVLFLLFSNPTEEDLDTLGYFDTTCDFNLTTVIYSCSPYETNPKETGLKDYVIGVAYGESEEANFSEAALKALMIIVKTNALAEGHYDSSGNKVINLNNCNYYYEDPYEELPDEEENKNKENKVKILERYYNEINNFLFVSKSYQSEITELGEEDALEYNDDIIEKLVETNKTGYEDILQEIYAVNDDEGETTITVKNERPYIFVGDSRTVGMRDSVSELTESNVIAEGSKEYSWFENTAVSSVTEKVNDGNSYNIISWLGVNDVAYGPTDRAQKYFEKYKELAQGSWQNHTIYVVEVGPVIDSLSEYAKSADVKTFNDKLQELIIGANISNLKYIDLNYNVDPDDGVHYNVDEYKTIFNDIISKLTTTKTIDITKTLFNNSEYCTYYRYNNSGCEIGWWYPIGENGEFDKGSILRGDPALLDTGQDNWGWRTDPVYGDRRYHNGSDLWANLSMNVVASRSGTVIAVNDGVADCGADCGGSGYGNYVVIDHGDGFFTRYGHLKKDSVSKYVSVGMEVAQGQIIGLSGNSGKSTGAHLHFEIREGNSWGTSLNPFDYISTDNPRPSGNCKNYNADKEGICHALKDLGFSDNAVAGLMANIVNEGGYDPTKVVPNDNGGPSYGIIGWHDQSTCSSVNVCDVSTKLPNTVCNGSKLKCYCQQNGMEWDTVACQTAYLKQYIDDYANSPGYDAANEIYGDYSAYEIAKQFSFKLERCSGCFAKDANGNLVPGPKCSERGSKAEELLPYVKNNCSN